MAEFFKTAGVTQQSHQGHILISSINNPNEAQLRKKVHKTHALAKKP